MVSRPEGRLSAGAVSESAAPRVVLACEEVCETSISFSSLGRRRAVGGVGKGAAPRAVTALAEVARSPSGLSSARSLKTLHVALFSGRQRSGRPPADSHKRQSPSLTSRVRIPLGAPTLSLLHRSCCTQPVSDVRSPTRSLLRVWPWAHVVVPFWRDSSHHVGQDGEHRERSREHQASGVITPPVTASDE